MCTVYHTMHTCTSCVWLHYAHMHAVHVNVHSACLPHAGLTDWLGRKVAIMSGGLIFLIGGLLQAVSFFLW